MTRTLLVVEGDLDRFFIGKLLTIVDPRWQIVRSLAEVGSWEVVVPKIFPHPESAGDITRMRFPVPVFYRRAPDLVAIVSAGSDVDKVIARARRDRETLRATEDGGPDAIGLVFDRDVPAAKDFGAIAAKIRDAGLPAPSSFGAIAEGPPRVGVYALPTHDEDGALEHLLLDCAKHVFAPLCEHAGNFVSSASAHLAGSREKAVVRSIGAILRPAKALESSLLEDAWVSSATVALPRLALLVAFLTSLLG